MRSRKKYASVILVITGVLIFSCFEVMTKTMNGVLTGSLLTFYRFLIGGLVLLPFGISDIKKREFKFTGKFVLQLIILSFLLVACSMTLSQYGIFLSSASMTAVIFSSNSLFVSLFAVPFLKEKLTKSKLLGLLIGICGLIITCSGSLKQIRANNTFGFGVLLIFVSMLIFSFYTVFNKKIISKSLGPVAGTSMTSIIGSITLIPLILIQSKGTNPFSFDIGAIWPQFLFIAIVGTGIGYYVYFKGLDGIDTGVGSMLFLIKPPLATILAFIFLPEEHSVIGIPLIVGMLLIFAGMTVAVTGVKKTEKISDMVSTTKLNDF